MAIIGTGDLASVINDREGAIFFVSGVSNSLCTDKKEFEREMNLLDRSNHYKCEDGNLRWGSNECLFYFSTLSVNFIDTPYTRHKLNMERLVRTWFDNYNIIRIGNITFGKNPHTFINYFRHCIEKGLPYTVRDEYKYLINEKELRLLTDNLPLIGRNEISVTGRIVKVQDLVNELLNEQREIRTNHK